MDTSASLLALLRDADDESAWGRLVELYTPLILGWLQKNGAAVRDRDDVVQEVLSVVVRRIPEFERQRTGSFRAWLRTITANCLRDHWRRSKKNPAAVGGDDFGEIIEQLADSTSGVSRVWDKEHDQHVMAFLLRQIRGEFSEKTWRSFQRFALDGLSADEVALELGVTANSVFIAKSRVMTRLRHLGEGLID